MPGRPRRRRLILAILGVLILASASYVWFLGPYTLRIRGCHVCGVMQRRMERLGTVRESELSPTYFTYWAEEDLPEHDHVWQHMGLRKRGWWIRSAAKGGTPMLEEIFKGCHTPEGHDEAEARRLAGEFFNDVRTRGAVEAVGSRGGRVSKEWH